MRILLTSGGTKVSIDKVRSITNMSKGTFGSAICKEFIERWHTVDFLMAEESKTPFKFVCHMPNPVENIEEKSDYQEDYDDWMWFVREYGKFYNEHTFKTFSDYESSLMRLLKTNEYDMVVLACAASDFGVSNYVNGKIRSGDSLTIQLAPYPKLISKIKEIQPDTYLVGFKLMVGSSEVDLQAEAEKSIEKNHCDVVVANDLEDIRRDNHTLLVVKPGETKRIEKFECQAKHTTLANELVAYIENSIAAARYK